MAFYRTDKDGNLYVTGSESQESMNNTVAGYNESTGNNVVWAKPAEGANPNSIYSSWIPDASVTPEGTIGDEYNIYAPTNDFSKAPAVNLADSGDINIHASSEFLNSEAYKNIIPELEKIKGSEITEDSYASLQNIVNASYNEYHNQQAEKMAYYDYGYEIGGKEGGEAVTNALNIQRLLDTDDGTGNNDDQIVNVGGANITFSQFKQFNTPGNGGAGIKTAASFWGGELKAPTPYQLIEEGQSSALQDVNPELANVQYQVLKGKLQEKGLVSTPTFQEQVEDVASRMTRGLYQASLVGVGVQNLTGSGELVLEQSDSMLNYMNDNDPNGITKLARSLLPELGGAIIGAVADGFILRGAAAGVRGAASVASNVYNGARASAATKTISAGIQAGDNGMVLKGLSELGNDRAIKVADAARRAGTSVSSSAILQNVSRAAASPGGRFVVSLADDVAGEIIRGNAINALGGKTALSTSLNEYVDDVNAALALDLDNPVNFFYKAMALADFGQAGWRSLSSTNTFRTYNDALSRKITRTSARIDTTNIGRKINTKIKGDYRAKLELTAKQQYSAGNINKTEFKNLLDIATNSRRAAGDAFGQASARRGNLDDIASDDALRFARQNGYINRNPIRSTDGNVAYTSFMSADDTTRLNAIVDLKMADAQLETLRTAGTDIMPNGRTKSEINNSRNEALSVIAETGGIRDTDDQLLTLLRNAYDETVDTAVEAGVLEATEIENVRSMEGFADYITRKYIDPERGTPATDSILRSTGTGRVNRQIVGDPGERIPVDPISSIMDYRNELINSLAYRRVQDIQNWVNTINTNGSAPIPASLRNISAALENTPVDVNVTGNELTPDNLNVLRESLAESIDTTNAADLVTTFGESASQHIDAAMYQLVNQKGLDPNTAITQLAKNQQFIDNVTDNISLGMNNKLYTEMPTVEPLSTSIDTLTLADTLPNDNVYQRMSSSLDELSNKAAKIELDKGQMAEADYRRAKSDINGQIRTLEINMNRHKINRLIDDDFVEVTSPQARRLFGSYRRELQGVVDLQRQVDDAYVKLDNNRKLVDDLSSNDRFNLSTLDEIDKAFRSGDNEAIAKAGELSKTIFGDERYSFAYNSNGDIDPDMASALGQTMIEDYAQRAEIKQDAIEAFYDQTNTEITRLEETLARRMTTLEKRATSLRTALETKPEQSVNYKQLREDHLQNIQRLTNDLQEAYRSGTDGRINTVKGQLEQAKDSWNARIREFTTRHNRDITRLNDMKRNIEQPFVQAGERANVRNQVEAMLEDKATQYLSLGPERAMQKQRINAAVADIEGLRYDSAPVVMSNETSGVPEMVTDGKMAKDIITAYTNEINNAKVATPLKKFMAGVSTSFRTFTTAINPVAWSRNFFRDSLMSTTLTGGSSYGAFGALNPANTFRIMADNYDFTPSQIRQAEAAIARVTNQTQFHVQTETKFGATTVDPRSLREKLTASEFEALRKSGIRNIIDGTYDILSKPGEVIEQMTRRQNVIRSLDDNLRTGLSFEDALTNAVYDGRKITTDFSIQNKLVGQYGTGASYLNAGFAGAESFAQMASLDPLGLVGKIFTYSIAPTIALYASNNSPENRAKYEQIPDYIKDSQLCLIIGDNLLTIPLPQEIAGFQAATHSLLETTPTEKLKSIVDLAGVFVPLDLGGFFEGDENTTLTDRAMRGIGVLGSQFLPDVAEGAYEVISGQSLFTGGETYKTVGKTVGNWLGLDENDDESQRRAYSVLRTFFGGGTDTMLYYIDQLNGVKEEDRAGFGFEKQFKRAFGRDIGKGESGASFNTVDNQFYSNIDTLEKEKDGVRTRLRQLDSQIRGEDDENEISKLSKEREEVVNGYTKKVSNTLKSWLKDFESANGVYDSNKEKMVLNLLNFNESVSLDPEGVAAREQQEAYFTTRDEVERKYLEMGIQPTNSFIIENSVQNIVGAPQRAAREAALVRDFKTEDGRTIKQVYDDYNNRISQAYATKDYALVEQLQKEYMNNYLLPATFPLVERYSGRVLARSSDAINELAKVSFVPYDFQKDNRGRQVYNSARMDEKRAYIKKYLTDLWADQEESFSYENVTSDQAVQQRINEIDTMINQGDYSGARARAQDTINLVNQGKMLASVQDMQKLYL